MERYTKNCYFEDSECFFIQSDEHAVANYREKPKLWLHYIYETYVIGNIYYEEKYRGAIRFLDVNLYKI